MHVNRIVHGERGGVLALSAVLIPVFLLFTALVVDVGNWFTHKRQLQNRADAGAFAAAVGYSKNWQGCFASDPTIRAAAARAIANAARQYSADPDPGDYTPDPIPASLYNDQIANQSKLDVVINSTDFVNNNDYSDDYDGNVATKLGDPCYKHPADDISAAGRWTDVKVNEKDLPSLFGTFGLPLSQNRARARVEVRPAISANKFLPIAVPDNIVTKVQVRYFDQCTGKELLKQDLAKLDAGTFDGYQSKGGGTLWAVPGGDPTVGDPSKSVSLPLNPYDPADCPSSSYRPIAEQVRVTSSPDVDIDQPCATLQDTSFADCFTRLSQIRVWNTGNADDEVRVREVRAYGGCGSPGDPYFGTLPFGQVNCHYDVEVVVDWGTRDDASANLNVPDNFKVSANGVPLGDPISWDTTTPGGTATYASNGGALTALPGANDIQVSLSWEDTDKNHSWGGPCSNKSTNPCKYSGAPTVHRVFVGKNSANTKPGSGYDPAATGTVESVHTSLDPVNSAGDLGPSFDNWRGGSPIPGCTTSSCQIYPTVGIRSALTTGTLVTLRTGDPQGSQLLACDPAVPNGQELVNFDGGCDPFYWGNTFSDPNWWTASTQRCPDSGLWYKLPAAQTPPYVNSDSNPWRCVLQSPGTSAGQTGDWFAVATDNCRAINSGGTNCQDFKKKTDADVKCGNYDGIGGDTSKAWLNTGDANDRRVVGLFIVPYQALKNVGGSGSNDEIPILRMAKFYVMNWYGQNNPSDDPCPDPDFKGVPVSPPGKASVIGVFVSTVDSAPGPVDPTADCRIDLPEPCRAVLVR